VTITAVALSCTLKASPADSSTDVLCQQILDALGEHDVEGALIRVVDHDVRPGVSSDEGDGDAWPAIRQEVLDADIVVLGTPIWMGQPSSVCKRVLERMDAFISETDDGGRMVSYDSVAVVATVGNEDGAHHVAAELYQALADVGFTIPANGTTYWVGEAMQSTDYRELPKVPEVVATATGQAARNAAHLARLLRADGYPPAPGGPGEKEDS
jgi:multimeric flavodoxin WrbA